MPSRPSPSLTVCALAAGLAVIGLFRSAHEPSPAPGGETAAVISIEGFAFSEPLPVEPGAAVTVTNADGAAHTLTARDGDFDTGLLGGGSSASFTAPTDAGTYEFFCELHPSMTGAVTVG